VGGPPQKKNPKKKKKKKKKKAEIVKCSPFFLKKKNMEPIGTDFLSDFCTPISV
jgi:hypothetical protein